MRAEWKRSAAGGLVAIASLVLSGPVLAQDWRAEWQKTVEEANGSELKLVVQPNPGFEQVIAVFKEKYPDIKVTYTNANPSAFAPRLITEQKNGLFAWDVWWSSASNMNFVALPADALEKVPDYLILPEVKDESKWQNPKYLYTSDRGPYVFVHTHYLQNLGYYNTDLVPGGELKSVQDMINPKLKGMIALRAPTRPHGGTQMLAAAYKIAGEDWLKTLFTDMEPVIVDNARQVTDGVIRGDFAVGIGTDNEVLNECLEAGGCQNIKLVPFNYMHSLAISIPKNPPNPAAAKVFVNWLLSKEGQDIFVREWGKVQDYAAHSMRKDVKPDPRQLDNIPDFSNLDQYVAVSLDSGGAAMDKVTELFNQSRKN